MHEHGLADAIIEDALRHPQRPAGSLPRRITVIVSELSGLTREALQASLDHVCEHFHMKPVELELETAPLLVECAACQKISALEEEAVWACPACGAHDLRLCGDETVIVKACEYELEAPL